jgi:two-component system chemotaxis sensor kinase CheA
VTTPESAFHGFLDDYFAECDEHLTAARGVLLILEQAAGKPGVERVAIEDLFRFFHSLKGISAMVELHPAEQLAHHLEHYLRAVRSRDLPVTPEGIEALLDGTQRLEDVIHAHQVHGPQPATDDILERVGRLVAGSGVALLPPPSRSDTSPNGTPERRWVCTFTPTRELLARGHGVDSVRKRLSAIGTILDAAPHVGRDGSIAFRFTVAATNAADFMTLQADGVDVEAAAAESSNSTDEDKPSAHGVVRDRRPSGEMSQRVAASHVVRVDLTRLDQLMTGVGDLVISRARLTESLSRIERHVPASDWRAIHENATVIDRQLRVLREGIMRVRLVSIGEIFRRMPFAARDIARETGKRVNVELSGQTTEIDKYLIERMMDPVLHLVRNAVSHGIEPMDARVAVGKRPEGTIALSASTAGEVVTLEVADDGAGINKQAVVARARAIGLPLASDDPDSSTLLSLLCAPGFSTKIEADRASGRGVGMAIVKATVEDLSGTMSLESEPGAGTRFIINLPLTLAITDALIGRVGMASFAVPQSAVREVIAVAAADVRTVEENEIVVYRGGVLSVVRLGRLFGIDASPADHFHLFVVGVGASMVGLAVDRIVGQREIVVRSMADPLVKVEGISGATDLGDGRVVLILDPATLSRLARQRPSRTLAHAGEWGRLEGR